MPYNLKYKYLYFLLPFILVTLFICPTLSESNKINSGRTKSIEVSSPIVPFSSHGDLWLTTWADDDSVFVSWGDGKGPLYNDKTEFSHHGLAKLNGTFPDVGVEIVQRFMPLSDDINNSKPTSMLFLDKRLYVAIHSPLLNPVKGFIAYSDDYGKTFKYDVNTTRNKSNNKNFICIIFINMGRNYELNKDGYVYAFGVEGEINISGRVYLVRMKKEAILDESSWMYYSGLDKDKKPEWNSDYKKAKKIPGLSSKNYSSMFPNLLFAAAYHPGMNRYIAMTATSVEGQFLESPTPWGPWRFVDKWFEGEDSEWYASYMPGIITKDMGTDYFYFTAAGRTDFDPQPGDFMYSFKLGKITMKH
ncbi:MAG TPA: DUF4185 domain-containing protein [bacterium]|nr:DUF4185 domain-containing protein [bacterium]